MSFNQPLPGANGLNPQVALENPSIYVAASTIPMNQQQANHVNQISAVISRNAQLMSMDPKVAQKQYSSMDPLVQQQLKSFYPDSNYMKPPQTNIGLRVLGDVVSGVTNPFKWAFKNVTNVYNRLLPVNTAYLILDQMGQGTPLSWNMVHNAWDGKELYNNKDLAALHAKYGNTDTFVAMKLLDGMPLGKIVDAYGTTGSDIINSIAKVVDNPQETSKMLAEFKASQLSVGRDIGRAFLNGTPADNKAFSSGWWKFGTGVGDAAAQILGDPLTYVSGGTSKLITSADKLAEALKAGTKTVAEVFARPEMQRTWNEVAGPLIEKLASARYGDKANIQTAADIRNELARQFPNMNNATVMDELARAKIFDAPSAQKFFSDPEMMTNLLAGRVDGTTFFRTGIPVAKRTNAISSKVNKMASDFFNGVASDEQKQSFGNLIDDVRNIGGDKSKLFQDGVLKSQVSTEGLEANTAQLSSVRAKIGRLVARFPGNAPIDVTDEGVDKSLSQVNALSRFIYTKTFSDYFTEAFKQSTQADRVLLLRGLYVQIMHNMALHATPQGQTLMENILKEKFGESAGYQTARDVQVPMHLMNDLQSSVGMLEKPVGKGNQLARYNYKGIVHNYQSKPQIGNMPWHLLSDYGLSIGQKAGHKAAIEAVGGHTARVFSRHMVNGWSTATLFPRLGIRASLDEMMFYSLSHPIQDLLNFGLGRKVNKIVTAFSGSDDLIPLAKKKWGTATSEIAKKLRGDAAPTELNPFTRTIANWLDQNPAHLLSDEARIKTTQLNGEDHFELQDKMTIANQLENYMRHVLPKGKAVINEAGEKVYPKQDQMIDYVKQLLVHTDGEMNSALIKSSLGRSARDIRKNPLYAEDFTDRNLLNRALADLKFVPTGKYDMMSKESLDRIHGSMYSVAHYKNWFLGFLRNGKNYGAGFFDPGSIFMKHGALGREGDLMKAVNDSLEKIGIDPEALTVKNQKAFDAFMHSSGQHVVDVADGLSPVQSAINRLEAMYLDLHEMFHGGTANAFNKDLYDHIINSAKEIQHQATEEGINSMSKSAAVRKAMQGIDYATFDKLTKEYKPVGDINTDLNADSFTKDLSNEGFMLKMATWAKHAPDQAMEWMDAQNQHIFRQPAMFVSYIKLRQEYAKLEQQHVANLIRANGWTKDFATMIAEKKFTEIARTQATDLTLKTINNPEIRSNLAWTLRTTGRFYRSVEDFYRRLWRLKDVTPQALYRLRMASLGLNASGFVHPDQNGDPYLIMPADNVLFHAMQGGMSLLGADPKQPLFDNFAMNLTMSNPTLNQDAGMPSLQGPFVGLSVKLAQGLLSTFGGSEGAALSQSLSKEIMGSVNQNLTWTGAIVPTSVQRVWNMIDPYSRSREYTSAFASAVAYNAATGHGLTQDQLNQMVDESGRPDVAKQQNAVTDYMHKIRITAHNIIFMREFLGLLSPITPTLQPSVGVPNYLKDAGVTSLRQEFNDILQENYTLSQGKLQDPYGYSLMMFAKNNPGLLAYTVSPTVKDTALSIAYTKENENWIGANKGAIDKYGNAALLFAPHIGKFDANSFAWMEASGLVKNKDLRDYYTQVSLAAASTQYSGLNSDLAAAMGNPDLTPVQKQEVMNYVRGRKQQILMEYPALKIQLDNPVSGGTGASEKMFQQLQTILANNDLPMSTGVKTKMQVVSNLVAGAIYDIKSIDQNPTGVDKTQSKEAIKNRTIEAIRRIGLAQGTKEIMDPIVQQASKSIFTPLLDSLVRNPSTIQIGK